MSSAFSQEEIVSELLHQFDDLREVHTFGKTTLFYNPGGELPRGSSFCTLQSQDGPGDQASALNRPGVFRFSFALPEPIYQEQFGAIPDRPPLGETVDRNYDFGALDQLQPHPVDAWQCWVQILSPGEAMFSRLQSFIRESYLLVSTSSL